MESFLNFLIRPLLTQPDDLKVSITGSTATIHIAQADMGRVIGKHGIIISALRQLMRIYCLTHNHPSITLTLAEQQ